jgi:hypothetical protein
MKVILWLANSDGVYCIMCDNPRALISLALAVQYTRTDPNDF